MRLIITRHWETEENKAGIIQGHNPGKLSAEWIEQAKKVALRLKDEKIDYIYSSDLARAADTAKEIAKFHTKTPIEFTEELREIYLGSFQGKKRADVGPRQPENGESFEELYNRAKKFLDKILSVHQNNDILFVWHNGINKAIIAVITGKKYEDIKEIEKQHNTSINIFEIDDNRKYKTHVFNCKKHLD